MAEASRRGRGRPMFSTPEKWCEWCGDTMTRKRWSSGRLEAPIVFAKRKFCSRKCNGESMSDGKPDREGYTQCTECGTRRPASSLTDGKCNDWAHCAEVQASKCLKCKAKQEGGE